MKQFLENGIIFGQTAFKILKTISEVGKDHNIILDEIHLKFDPIYFNRDFNHLYRIRKISNCKLQATSKHEKTKYFLYKDMPGAIIKSFSLELMINSMLQNINIEDIVSVQINVLLQPLIDLRKCQSINEALMNWSLNNIFLEFQDYFNHKKLINSSLVTCDPLSFKRNVSWFLANENIDKFVPKRFLQKVNCIQKSKKILIIEFMDVVERINEHFIKMVRKYYKTEHVAQITSYNYIFPIELYGKKDEIYHPTCRKSLYLVRKSKDYLHLKSFAVLFNLRWFFNTRYNSKKSLGFDKEYGRTINGYGQTIHKYDDVLLWLITHPNTIEDVEFVILDPIPPNYIFTK